MKKSYTLVGILLLFTSKLMGVCLEVSDIPKQCTQNKISVATMSHSFNLKTQKLLKIPLYIASDSNEEITMTLGTLSQLRNTQNETIGTRYSYLCNGHRLTIEEGIPFTLLAAGAVRRNGSTLVGMLEIEVDNMDSLQTAGDYRLETSMRVGLNTISDTGQSILSTTAYVEYLTLVAFDDILTAYTKGEKFIDHVIEYGTLKLQQINRIRKILYVKNNTPNNVTVSFIPSDLMHTLVPEYKIKMRYRYTPNNGTGHLIEDSTAFTIARGKQNGVAVGVMDFETEALPSSLLAGEYRAVLHIKVQARL